MNHAYISFSCTHFTTCGWHLEDLRCAAYADHLQDVTNGLILLNVPSIFILIFIAFEEVMRLRAVLRTSAVLDQGRRDLMSSPCAYAANWHASNAILVCVGNMGSAAARGVL